MNTSDDDAKRYCRKFVDKLRDLNTSLNDSGDN